MGSSKEKQAKVTQRGGGGLHLHRRSGLVWNEGSREEYGLLKGYGVQGTVLKTATLTRQRNTEQSMGLHEDESVVAKSSVWRQRQIHVS